MKIYGIKESNIYGDNYNLFKTKEGREHLLKELLNEYSIQYNKKMTIYDLENIGVFITLFDEKLYE